MTRNKLGKTLIVEALLALAVTAAGATTRLAIGTLGLNQDNRDAILADLVAHELSATPGLELVERRELDAALTEASLSLGAQVRAADAVRLGALLRADQFLLGSTFRLNGTNNLAIRLVDGRSGAMRAIKVFPDSVSLPPLARNLAQFIREESPRPAGGRRDYLAIGVVQNLGVNNRFPDFPAQLRAALAAHLSGKVTVLERDVVSFLANEVRLDMAGLTERKEGEPPPVQFGFWIVDGFYQSYEVAEPEVQLRLRVERVLGGQQARTVQAKPDEQFFRRVVESILTTLDAPSQPVGSPAPTRKGEITALEARARQLADYVAPIGNLPGRIQLRSARNPDTVMNTLDEATRVFESILLLDPENNAARMRLAACLLFDARNNGGRERGEMAPRLARAQDCYREVIASSDPTYAQDARISLACSCWGFSGVDLLRRFAAEVSLKKDRDQLRYYGSEMLQNLAYRSPIETVMPYFKEEMLQRLREARDDQAGTVSVDFGPVLFPYRNRPADRERVTNELLPGLLAAFPDLEPYLLLAAAAEQVTTNSQVTAQFLASLQRCEEHPDTVPCPRSYFTRLSSTLAEEDDVRKHGGSTHLQRTFQNRQYTTVVRMSLARQRTAQKDLAPPLTDLGRRRLAESYMALGQWQAALDLFNELPDVAPEVKNECRSHLGVARESEGALDPSWTNSTDIAKVKLAYECIARQRWTAALAILDSMGHRTVRMNVGGPWGYAFTPVLPALVADECRAKAGKPKLVDPVRFEIGDTPYVHFIRDGPRTFSFEVVGEDLWLAVYSQIKRFRGPGPFAALAPCELHEFPRTTRTGNTAIAVGPDFVWAGTADDGLLELDRRSGACRRLTMEDGMLLNGISCLRLQGQTLWIGYRNGENGAVGALDVRTHKFSSLTPNLSPRAGADSRRYFDSSPLNDFRQPPQQPVSCMAEGGPGEMWFAVPGKGLQRSRTSEGSWVTVAHDARLLDDPAYVQRGLARARQGGWQFTSLSTPSTPLSAIAVDASQGRVLVATRDPALLDNERSVTGGLILYDGRENKETVMQVYEGLPSNELTAVALDGPIAWVGGRGFVAIIDVPARAVRRVAFVSASSIKRIQLDKAHAWIQVSCGVDFYPDAGNAWTGVYRVARASVEPRAVPRS